MAVLRGGSPLETTEGASAPHLRVAAITLIAPGGSGSPIQPGSVLGGGHLGRRSRLGCGLLDREAEVEHGGEGGDELGALGLGPGVAFGGQAGEQTR